MFADLQDPRVVQRCDHELCDVLIIALCCLLCGGETFNDMEEFGRAKHDWFKTYLTLRHGIPRHDTFNRVFAALKPEAFLDCFLRWTQSVRQTVAGKIVAVDGKALRRAGAKGQSPRYIVSAWASANRLVLGQLKVADKSNEITAVPPLLRALELAGGLVTVDALGCQKQIAKEIIEADANYVLSRSRQAPRERALAQASLRLLNECWSARPNRPMIERRPSAPFCCSTPWDHCPHGAPSSWARWSQ